MNDGHHYTALQHNTILKYDLRTGKVVDTILDVSSLMLPGELNQVDDYTFSDNESQILLATGTESISPFNKRMELCIQPGYRKTTKLSDVNKQMHALFLPDGKRVAYVMDNDLYFKRSCIRQDDPGHYRWKSQCDHQRIL
ncbi:MAG: hypothetical protein IPP15_14635 [Saprospiraceae bacterium]|uniref:Uncharacterized protein n=1 Tax=Candidatus Opimibacter skivensis TaxID=2982028 RepID=A0A9D7XTE5_9BACT|nr:hypothetical protein [Candidatus Opimibacter skivensis]